MSYVAKSDTGSSARCNIFDTATNTTYEDDNFGFLQSITGSATSIVQTVAPVSSYDTDRLDFFERLTSAYLHADILELQGIDLETYDQQNAFSPDSNDMDAIHLMRDMRKADSLPFEAWILPELQNAKRLRKHLLGLSLHDTNALYTKDSRCAFMPYDSRCRFAK
jgi:hypothetical protein